ncbi:hypothetical protein Talka_01355 [Tepidimonas alkaliphilus]|uniref:Inner membrane protein YgaP-like transmembrane domain-containing protein n=1 Tax=Tepidimonas alkaliphilus TaxID=2588942 RepID=A0A554W7T6_9BURK|nr:DUF2892 domain-containing protein [Tepidimonas alkaliphilus]TSE19636.1 hypothetical protein Talka_01355 [Tepidimonas alkaliphilus]
MTRNVGGLDRVLRIIIGLALIVATATGTIGVWGWIGILPLATGLIGWCPPYAIFGINTCKTEPKQEG